MKENRIGSERVRIRMSQDDLAKQLGVSNKTVSNWEQGKASCPPTMIVRLAEMFGCTTDYLLGVTQDRTPRSA